MIGWTLEIEPCPPEAREAALEVLYQRIPDSLRSRLVTEVFHEALIWPDRSGRVMDSPGAYLDV